MLRKPYSTAPLLLGLLVFAVAAWPLRGQATSPANRPGSRPSAEFAKTSLCESLAHPEQFDRKAVEIHATYSATWEGAWLSSGECKGIGDLVPPFQRQLAQRYGVAEVLKEIARRYGIADVVRDKSWQEFDSSSRRLYTGMSMTLADGTIKQGDYDYVTADFAGVLAIKRNFRVRDGFGNGWGHLGMSRFLLILRSVSNVSPHPCACAPIEGTPPVLHTPPRPLSEVLKPT